MQDAQDLLLKAARSSLAGTLELMSQALRGAERLRTHQLGAAEHALAENATFIARIKDIRSFEDLATTQLAIANAQLKNVLDYWSGFHRAVQSSLTEIAEHGQSRTRDLQRNLTESLEDSLGSGPSSLVQVFRTTLDAMAPSPDKSQVPITRPSARTPQQKSL